VTQGIATADPRHHFERILLSDEFYAEGAAVGDINGDGMLDVVAGPFWYEGPDLLERHAFYPAESFPIEGYSENFVAHVCDLNGDARPDVLVVGFPGKAAHWYENPGPEPGYWKQHLLFAQVDNESPAFHDMNGDGAVDLILTTAGKIGYAVADPARPHEPWNFHAVSAERGFQQFTHGLGAGDVDGDGRLDLLEKTGWWQQPEQGQGDGIWRYHPVEFSQAGGAQMYARDVDGDGDNDVITSVNAHGYGLAWFEQYRERGVIQFRRHLIMSETAEPGPAGVSFSQLHAIEIADINGDGLEDLVTGKRFWAHGGHDPGGRDPAVLYWFECHRDESGVQFVPHRIDTNSGVGTQFTTADLDGDGRVDIVTSSKKGTYVHRHHLSEATGVEADRASAARENTPRQAADGASMPREWPALALDGTPLNLDFERGDLTHWHATGDAFEGQPVWGDTVHARRADSISGHVGDRWIGTYERAGDAPQGTLTSDPFRIAHRFCSYYVGGGSHATTRVELFDVETGDVLFESRGHDAEQMKPVTHDLTQELGRMVSLRIIDESSGPWGHINFDHFRFHDERPQEAELANRLPPLDDYPFAGLDAERAAAAMQLPPGFRATVFASEPDVRQPIAMAMDDRGRVWIAEAYEYPRRATEGAGRDRILIFADHDGDGRFDERKVFAEGLNLVSGLEVGFGGVWVGAAPYLLFIPDRDGDDRPDGDPQVLLDGWGYQDTHETLNAFVWGPDGWLYGCHGVFTHSLVGKPGTPDPDRTALNAAIWRYHPTRHVFEVFAHGTSNPWGVDFTPQGQAVCTACVIPHLFHIIQGGRYQRQAGSHFNPHTYDDIKTIADHRHYVGDTPHSGNLKSDQAGGGHAHAGAMIYLGGAWPEQYHGQIFMNNIHGQRLNVDVLETNGSGLVGRHGKDFLLTRDQASQIINLRYGPDGQVFVIDWYDMQACHHGDTQLHDRSNGRIYKIQYGDSELEKQAVDLANQSDTQLAEMVLHPNDWYVRHARRLLQERAAERAIAPAAIGRLRELALRHTDSTRRLRAAWALQVIGGLDSDLVDQLLADAAPHVRGWAIQLALDHVAPELSRFLPKWVAMAGKDPEPVVRLYLASAAGRIAPAERWELLAALMKHPEDAEDPNLPHMYWYAAEPLAEVDTRRALRLALDAGESLPQVRAHMVRRIGSLGTDKAQELLVQSLRDSSDVAEQLALLAGMLEALQGRRAVVEPPSWRAAYARLREADDPELRSTATSLGVLFGDREAFEMLRQVAARGSADPDVRRRAVESLLAVADGELVPTLYELLRDPALRGVALTGLARYDASETPGRLLAVYDQLPLHEKRQALATLCSRPAYAMALLDAIGAGRIAPADLSADLARQVTHLNQEDLTEKLARVWGQVRSTPEDRAAQITQYRELVTSSEDQADLWLGRAVFAKTCQQCHTLYGVGQSIGPDLTGSNRSNLDYLLSNLVDPSALISKEYQSTIILTEAGRTLSGLVTAEDDATVTLRNATETIVVAKDQIDHRSLSELSIMPDNQLQQFSPQEIVSLIAYLRGNSQVPVLATSTTAALLFDGRTLTGWHGDERLWSVEGGEIVGKTSTGIARNAFLVSDLGAEDFELTLEVKLVENAGNSGIQFRSKEVDGGDEVSGYQADVGAGWWGKLYEELGRGLLWDRSGEEFVRPGEWNRYVIRAEGSRIRTWINDRECVDLDDPDGAQRGVFALQLHSGGPTEVRFRNLRLEVPAAAGHVTD
jgi:putative membrane-bound dehydrogenase-like protein